VRVALLALLLVVSSGCGGDPRDRAAADGAQRRSHEAQPAVASSNLEAAARDLLPATVTTSHASAHFGRCLGPFGRPVRCFTLQARGGGRRLRDRRKRLLAAARARGWSLTRIQTAPAGSSTLVFSRGRLEGRLLLARSADVTIVFVSVPSATTAEEARFVTAARAACKRFAATVGRIPRSLPREEGLRRVRATWHTLVEDVARVTPPPALRERHRAFIQALRQFEGALLPFRPLRVAEAANRVERSAQSIGLAGCIPD
jgi:hypothetical protein